MPIAALKKRRAPFVASDSFLFLLALSNTSEFGGGMYFPFMTKLRVLPICHIVWNVRINSPPYQKEIASMFRSKREGLPRYIVCGVKTSRKTARTFHCAGLSWRQLATCQLRSANRRFPFAARLKTRRVNQIGEHRSMR